MHIKLFIITLFFACAAACNQAPTTIQNPTSNAPTNVSANATPNQITISTYHGAGVVEAIDRAKNRVKINHQEIKGYMDAMTMSFKSKDARLLDGLSVGDKIDFTLEDAAGIVTITEISGSKKLTTDGHR